MEAMGSRDAGGLGRWSYREESGSSTISSSSGTIVSTPAHYTPSSFSPPSSLTMEAAIHFDLLEFHGDEDVAWEETEREEHIKILVQEFFGRPSSLVNCSTITNSGDICVLERWLQQLGVGWVLCIADGASEWRLEHTFHASSWVRALAEIMVTSRLVGMLWLCPGRGTATEGLLPSICEEQEPDDTTTTDQFQFAQFIQKTLLEMLTFVDVIVAPNAKTTSIDVLAMKLSTLLRVRGALSDALAESFHFAPSTEVERMQGGISSLFSAKEDEVGDAIWSTMEQIKMELNFLPPQGSSSDIHKAIPSITNHIRFLEANYSLVAPIVSEAARLGKYVPQITQVPPLMSLIMETASCVEENLASKSESFLDQALKFLFLLNNIYFLRQQLHYDTHSLLQVHVATFITHKVEGYMESYIQASWAPVLSCLISPIPLFLGRNYSPLSKFESQFQKTYTSQKQWKVPDPKLRKMLRRAITKKIIPGYKKYIEDIQVTDPKFSPHELEEMLQEMFEG